MRGIPRGIIESNSPTQLAMSSLYLFFLIPLFSIAIIILAWSHSPGPLQQQSILAYIYIASLTLLSAIAGALPLSHSSSPLSEHQIQTLLCLFIAIPVLHLPPTYVPHLSIRTLHTSILVITLSIATLLALISPFLPTQTPLLYIPPSLFLLYTIQTIPRIAYILHNFLYPEVSIQFQNTIPLTLPSPASTASFPDQIHHIRKHHHKIPSVSSTSTITIVDRTRISFPRCPHSSPPPPPRQEQEQEQLRSQILNSRSRSLLVFILAVQIAALAANACALGVTISPSNTLKTVQTACTVLAVTGSMSAYLLHTYNLHLRQSPTPTTISIPNHNSLSASQLQMIESQQHHSNSHSPMLIQLAPPPLPKTKRKRANAGVSIEKNPFNRNAEANVKGATTTKSELELELDVVMDIGRYSMALGRGGGDGTATTTELELGLVSGPACTAVPVPLPVPLPLRVSLEEGSRCGGWSGVESGNADGGGRVSALEKQKEREKEKDKIQGYYLSSSSSISTGSPPSPFSPFERCGTETETETDPSSPDTPYPNLPNTSCGNTQIQTHTHTQVRKRSSFFGWEFAWDQEALERADDTGKLRSPVRWKSDVNVDAKLNTDRTLNSSTSDHIHSQSKKIQPFLIVDDENFMDIGGDREPFGPSPSLSRPHSLSSEADVVGREVKRGMSWRRSVCGVVGVGGEKVKRKNKLGLVIGMKPLRLSRSFGGSANANTNSSSRGGGNGNRNGRGIGHQTVLSGDVGPMCGLSLKRKAVVLMSGQGSPVSPVSGSAISSRVMGQGNGNADADATRTITAAPTTPKRLKKKANPGHSATAGAPGTSLNPESEIGESPSRESKNNAENHSIGFIHGDNRKLDSDDELDEHADTQKTPTMTSRTTTSDSPQSYRYSPSSSPNQQRHEAATSESHCSSIDESCLNTTTANTNSPSKLSPSLTRRGLSLKRSFKMGLTVGRTLGPGLTLSSAGLSSFPDTSSVSGSVSRPTSISPSASAYESIRRCESDGFGFKEDGKRGCQEKGKEQSVVYEAKEKDGEKKKGEEDVDVDVDVAARPVSASYASATPAATILTPATGADVGDGIGHGSGSSGCASRSGGSGSPANNMTVSKSMLRSRPLLPILSTTTTTATSPSASSCSTITQQYNSSFLTMTASRRYAWKPHPFVDWFKPLETSTTRGDDDVVSIEQEMAIIGGSSRGNDNDRLPSSQFPPFLLPPMTPPPQSQSLPPTPTKSRSTLVTKPSMSSFRKRSAPPVLPPPSGSSECTLFPHSMSTTNGAGVGGAAAAASKVSLTHSMSQSIVGQGQGQGQTISKPPSQPPSRPTTPKPNTRLSAMNMGTVRSAFAGVGAKVSARMSINSTSTRGSAGAAAGNAVASNMGMGMDGDFMDLRDPFASPPPSKLASLFRGGNHTGGGGGDFWVSERAMSSLGGASGAGVTGYEDDEDVKVGNTRRISSVSGEKRRMNMNAWGRLPMPSTTSSLLGSAPGTSNISVPSLVASRKKAHPHHGERRKHKERRARKAAAAVAGNGVLGETNSSLHGYSIPYNAGEDTDFDVEEALLSQRLLRRLDSVEWD